MCDDCVVRFVYYKKGEKMADKIVCSYCHKEVDAEHKFCPNCGKQVVPLKVFSCPCDGFEKEHPIEFNYCPECGRPAKECLDAMLEKGKVSKRAFTGYIPEMNAVEKKTKELKERENVKTLVKQAKDLADKVFEDKINQGDFVPIFINYEYGKAYLNDEDICKALHEKFHCWGFGKQNNDPSKGVIYFKDIALKDLKKILAFYLGRNVSEFKGSIDIEDIPNFDAKYKAFKKNIGIVDTTTPKVAAKPTNGVEDFNIDTDEVDEL